LIFYERKGSKVRGRLGILCLGTPKVYRRPVWARPAGTRNLAFLFIRDPLWFTATITGDSGVNSVGDIFYSDRVV